jgi:hypothetical protein
MSSYRARLENLFASTRFLLFVSIVCWTVTASARQTQHPIFALEDSVNVWFDKIVSPENAPLVNGEEYHISFKGLTTHPFYRNAESNRASVRYNNDMYENINLLYDTYADILVLKTSTSTGTFFVELDKDLVQSFTIHNHHFKKIYGGPATKGNAYYDVLFEEKQFAVLVRRIKLGRTEGVKRDYFEDDVHFILDNGRWTRITGKRSFSKKLKKDQRKALTGFIKSNGINVRKRKDEDFKKLGAFCYSLKELKQ